MTTGALALGMLRVCIAVATACSFYLVTATGEHTGERADRRIALGLLGWFTLWCMS